MHACRRVLLSLVQSIQALAGKQGVQHLKVLLHVHEGQVCVFVCVSVSVCACAWVCVCVPALVCESVHVWECVVHPSSGRHAEIAAPKRPAVLARVNWYIVCECKWVYYANGYVVCVGAVR